MVEQSNIKSDDKKSENLGFFFVFVYYLWLTKVTIHVKTVNMIVNNVVKKNPDSRELASLKNNRLTTNMTIKFSM